MNQMRKKRKYNEIIIAVEHGSFTPIVFSAMGGMGRETQKYLNRIAECFAEKRKEKY